MMKEFSDVRQIPGEGKRRWFCDAYFDLIVWYQEDGSISGFQLCYDKGKKERALTWYRDHGYSHDKIDGGDNPGYQKRTPILVADGLFDSSEIAERFKMESIGIDPQIADFVHGKLLDFPK
ncbi:MAG: hypothetical protein EHM28_02040 [Spirochaetaceae bacterium]|nr:MAG: hypothetical protein EHM28_02040 [Spirochaetaceae bacterium]